MGRVGGVGGKVGAVTEKDLPGEQDTTSGDPDDEAIDEAVEESFPASDSPSSWSGPPTRPH